MTILCQEHDGNLENSIGKEFSTVKNFLKPFFAEPSREIPKLFAFCLKPNEQGNNLKRKILDVKLN